MTVLACPGCDAPIVLGECECIDVVFELPADVCEQLRCSTPLQPAQLRPAGGRMSTLVAKLIDLAVRIGRWLLEHAARKGLSRLVGYMDGKIDDFKRRRTRARRPRRVQWLTGRIERWTTALKWLIANGPKLGADALQAVCDLPKVRNLPIVAACEREPA